MSRLHEQGGLARVLLLAYAGKINEKSRKSGIPFREVFFLFIFRRVFKSQRG